MDKNYDKQINKIWNENPKIPFMQSKEILRLGYIYGINEKTKDVIVEESKDTIKNVVDNNIDNNTAPITKVETKPSSVVVDDNINFDNASKKLNKQRSRRGKIEPNQYTLEGKLKVDVIDYVLILMDKKRDFLEVYEELQNYKDQLRNQYGI